MLLQPPLLLLLLLRVRIHTRAIFNTDNKVSAGIIYRFNSCFVDGAIGKGFSRVGIFQFHHTSITSLIHRQSPLPHWCLEVPFRCSIIIIFIIIRDNNLNILHWSFPERRGRIWETRKRRINALPGYQIDTLVGTYFHHCYSFSIQISVYSSSIKVNSIGIDKWT